ncbi:serine/threonine-protein kinase BLUS1 isoform X2 [Cryptomeria japonica]|uniref:serine/threonine-protein kinase BLUS1 isoform X2 n=1 Tax=Cryptomeria japonica TaxID=3369 RepID=UPI0027D9E88C|nr:serine/threonine-protein kinase BLUS1 isoform X2 [Cryptomeria japonica]
MKMGRKSYPASDSDYKLLEEVGYGASATVYRAICLPFNEVVAVKCLDLDRCNSNLDDIRREAQTMSLIDHPNVIRAYCSFVVDRYLWVVMPFMAEGSCLHIMKIAYPDGFEESVIATVLKETLKALEYLHRHGHIHRDVKAGNILVDSSGTVKLGDFGVSACMFDTGDRQRSRNTFVGTPCWMAPEVLQPGGGYDFKADIWSLGITALELAHGHAPFSKYPPMKVLLMTIQNAPPGLDYDRDKKFSKSFKEMIAMCLVKDQTKRPTAEKLLKHSFFKQGKSPEYVVRNLLQGLPPLWDRVRALQLKDSAQLALKKMPSAEQEALSQSEYKRGVSAWNFDIEDLKAQAALMQDDDELSGGKEEDDTSGSTRHKSLSMSLETSINSDSEKVKTEQSLPLLQSSSINDLSNLSDFKNQGRKETKDIGCVDLSNGETNITNTNRLEDLRLLDSSKIDDREQQKKSLKDRQNNNGTSVRKTFELEQVEVTAERSHARPSHQAHSGPLMVDRVLGYERERNGRNLAEPFKQDLRKDPILSGPLGLPNRASANSLSAPLRSSGGFKDYQEDKSKAGVVQKKGRFSVTSEDVDLAENVHLPSISRRPSQIALELPKDPVSTIIPVAVITPYLQNLLQQTITQEELLFSLLTSLQQTEASNPGQPPGKWSSQSRNGGIEPSVETAAERERALLAKIVELQSQILSLTEELHAVRHKSTQLQRQLDAVYSREEEERSQKGRKEKEGN